VEHGLVPLDEDLSPQEAERVMSVINDTLRGARLGEVANLPLQEGPQGWYAQPVRAALSALRQLLNNRIRQRLYVEGALNLVDALRDVNPQGALDQFVGLIHAIEDEMAFIDAVRAARADRGGLVASVGECPRQGLENYSVITCDYRPYAGIVGVIGPLWVDYGKALSAAAYVANRLEGLLVASCARSAEEAA